MKKKTELIEQPASIVSESPARRVVVGKYKESRFWGIWIDDELLAVTVYRKGALAILDYLDLDADK